MARSRSGLYRREGGIFAFRYQDEHLRWREKYTGCTTHKDAKVFRQQFERDLADGVLPTKKSTWTVEQACTLWVKQHAARLTSQKGRRNEQSFLRQLVRVLGTRKLKTITLDDLKNYQQHRSEHVQARAINVELQILVNVLKEENLWRKAMAENFRRLPEPKSLVGQALTTEQLHHLQTVAASRDAWQVAYYAEVLGANTGLRGCEIKRLRLGTVDLEKRRIQVKRSGTKTDRGERLVELNLAATEAACKLFVRAQSLGASSTEHYLLPANLSRHTKKGDPLHGQCGFDFTRHQVSWDTAWGNLRDAAAQAILDAAKKENRELTREEQESVNIFQQLRFHSLRHTFVTIMAERGVPLPVVQAMVGHMSPEMTRYYTHISNRAAREAVELLDRPVPGTGLVGNLVGKPDAEKSEGSKLLN
jgi:integrase